MIMEAHDLASTKAAWRPYATVLQGYKVLKTRGEKVVNNFHLCKARQVNVCLGADVQKIYESVSTESSKAAPNLPSNISSKISAILDFVCLSKNTEW